MRRRRRRRRRRSRFFRPSSACQRLGVPKTDDIIFQPRPRHKSAPPVGDLAAVPDFPVRPPGCVCQAYTLLTARRATRQGRTFLTRQLTTAAM